MPNGVKSSEFGCIWKTMFLVAMCYPDKFDSKNKEHIQKKKHYQCFYKSLQYVIPCKFCRDFMQELIVPRIPVDFSGRVGLMYSIYQWKDTVNRKLILQGNKCESSPPFEEVLKQYENLTAKCDAKKGKCV
jgi:hypothetical protein